MDASAAAAAPAPGVPSSGDPPLAALSELHVDSNAQTATSHSLAGLELRSHAWVLAAPGDGGRGTTVRGGRSVVPLFTLRDVHLLVSGKASMLGRGELHTIAKKYQSIVDTSKAGAALVRVDTDPLRSSVPLGQRIYLDAVGVLDMVFSTYASDEVKLAAAKRIGARSATATVGGSPDLLDHEAIVALATTVLGSDDITDDERVRPGIVHICMAAVPPHTIPPSTTPYVHHPAKTDCSF